VVRREHGPERAQHRVERCVRHGQVLGVTEAELDVEPFGCTSRRSGAKLPQQRTVVHLVLTGAGAAEGWLKIERGAISVCKDDPGYDVDLAIEADTRQMQRWLVGLVPFPPPHGQRPRPHARAQPAGSGVPLPGSTTPTLRTACAAVSSGAAEAVSAQAGPAG